MISVNDFYNKYGEELGLILLEGHKGLSKIIQHPEIYRPGLSIAGHIKNYDPNRMFIFGRSEIEYLRENGSILRLERLTPILIKKTPLVIITRSSSIPEEITILCKKNNIPLFSTPQIASPIINKLAVIFNEEFAPYATVHGTLVEVFGIGILIQGESSVGKSETALNLIEKGHRLVSDDVVILKKRNMEFIGSGPEIIRHIIEIRGIGIINIALLYGATSIRQEVKVDLVIELKWDNGKMQYQQEESFAEFCGLKLPKKTLLITTGKNLSLLIETIAINHRLSLQKPNSII
jgi:HPr kinase/phosphorylase